MLHLFCLNHYDLITYEKITCCLSNFISTDSVYNNCNLEFAAGLKDDNKTINVTEGCNITLLCSYGTNVSTDCCFFQWIHKDDQQTKITVSYDEVLYLDNIKRSESGKYACVCNGTNCSTNGKPHWNVQLNVLCE